MTAALVLASLVFFGALVFGWRSWRIGVDTSERTALVSRGLFRIARNPIFTSMLLVLAGAALLVPGGLSVSAFIAALVGVELQVRLVEEPYLLRTHGGAYRYYARRVGRFVPFIGRLNRAQAAGGGTA